jgi:deoxyribonuclease-4
MSIAGGLYKAADAAAALGMETVQIFTHSPSQWMVRPRQIPGMGKSSATGDGAGQLDSHWRPVEPIPDGEVGKFLSSVAQGHIAHTVCHGSYLLNLASSDEGLRQRSIEAAIVELNRAEQLAIPYVVIHPGAHMGSGEEAGIAQVIASLDEIFARTPKTKCGILLETTAGQGSSLGHVL